MSYIKDNLALWQEHDRLMAEYEAKQERVREIIYMAVEGMGKALMVLEDDVDKGCDMLRDLVSRLEGER